MNNSRKIPVTNIVANVIYTLPDLSEPETLTWKYRGEVQYMTVDQFKAMLALHPAYKNYLMPPKDVMEQLDLTEHYKALLEKNVKRGDWQNCWGWSNNGTAVEYKR